MDQATDIRDKIEKLFISQKLAVLATSDGGQPYTSLVAFRGTADLKHLYFVTPKATRKFANLLNDQRVSMLINNAVNADDDFHDAYRLQLSDDQKRLPDRGKRRCCPII